MIPSRYSARVRILPLQGIGLPLIPRPWSLTKWESSLVRSRSTRAYTWCFRWVHYSITLFRGTSYPTTCITGRPQVGIMAYHASPINSYPVVFAGGVKHLHLVLKGGILSALRHWRESNPQGQASTLLAIVPPRQ